MRINIKVLGILIVLFSFLEPDYFTSKVLFHAIFYMIRIISVFIAILWSIQKRQFLHVSAIFSIYYIFYFYSTFQNDGDYNVLISHLILTVGFVMWLEILLKNYPTIALYSLNIIYSALVYFNILFFILFPDGYASSGHVNRYFLGVYNQFAATLIPAVVISVTYSLFYYKRIIFSTKLLIFAVFITFIYFWSATSIVGICLLIFYLIFLHKRWLRFLINNKIILLSIVFLFLLVVYFTNLDIFSFIIEDLLEKDLTLSTRTRIWEEAKLMINESPYYGYGSVESGRYIYFSSYKQRDAHNMVLQLLLQSGVLGLSVFILLIIYMFRQISKYKSHVIAKFILYSLFVSTTMMLSEVYSFRFLLLIILLGILTPNIIQFEANNVKKPSILTLDR